MMHPLHQALAQFCPDDWIWDGPRAQHLGYSITGSLLAGHQRFWVQGPMAPSPQPLISLYQEHGSPSLQHALYEISQKMQGPEMEVLRNALIQDLIGKTLHRHWSIRWQDHAVYGYSQDAPNTPVVFHGPVDMRALLRPDLHSEILQWSDVVTSKDEQDVCLYHQTLFFDVPQTLHERLGWISSEHSSRV